MADTSLIIGNGNWAVKENSLLGYNIIQGKYVPIEMNVSRATTATRVNSLGLVEVVPKNLFSQSQTFDNAGWTPYPAGASTVIPNVLATSAPNGTFTADKLVANAVAGDHWLLQSATISFPLVQLTVSVFAKKAELSNIQLYNNAGGGGLGDFDLSTGNSSGVGTSMEPYPDDWYRCIMTYTTTPSAPNFNIHIRLANSSGNISFTGNGVDGVYLWGAQLEQGSTATSYFPTTDRFNIPRVDYSTGTASLLVEPARTNLLLRSEEFNDVSWSKTGVTVIANAVNSPTGTLTADSITPIISDAKINQGFNPTGALQHNFSVYLRSATGSTFSTILRITRDNPFISVASTTITVTTEWQRFNLSFTALDTTTHQATIGSNSTLETGKNFYAWGAQLEAGSNATSYIPTTTLAAGVTRTADLISKTGISSLIGQTEGTIFVDAQITNFAETAQSFITISDGTITNRVELRKSSSSQIVLEGFASTGSFPSFTLSSVAVGRYKIAVAYQSGNSYGYINGAQVGTTSSNVFAFTSLTNIIVGANATGSTRFLNDRINLATVFQTRLSPGQLATLTTL